MSINIKTQVELNYIEVADVINQAIEEYLDGKGITINVQKIELASIAHQLPYTSPLNFEIRLTGDFDVKT